ncbi:DedA family protein [Bdellovibrio sp. SKB1291214]|uniref:DedA family protein n=1 Tax=Bdellovibrio sp. SKB1291214 TaxID=1732569 RepID=UPI0020CCB7A4|nr:DedA family protein [Bdellovibrio sp. SKB1291214]UYL07693.1 DedA family protein [Bdellovibrio sp. SKB1291214]
MEFANEPIFQWMSQFAYQPYTVYFALIGMMLLSAVGLPLPEEVTLISVGILAFMGAHPDHFPPPYPGAPVVNVHTAAIIAFFAVFLSDFLIYGVGRVFGRKLLYHPRVHKMFPPHLMKRVEEWTHKYGAYACGIFRFTPGIRFPGHLACGMLHFPVWKFLLIDGLAAAISVPTQIYLLAHYGEPILMKLRQFKLVVFGVIGLLLIYFLFKKIREKMLQKKNAAT